MSSMLEIKPFPEVGYTLAINGIGQKSNRHIKQFLKAVKYSGGLKEVLGVSLIGSNQDDIEEVESLLRKPNESPPFLRKFLSRSQTEIDFEPSVIAGDATRAAEVFGESSGKQGDSLR